jgi:hypothetical protein
MTTFQKTLNAYANGQKSMAFLAFKNDADSIKEITFEQFCISMDKIIIQHEVNKGVNPITKKIN